MGRLTGYDLGSAGASERVTKRAARSRARRGRATIPQRDSTLLSGRLPAGLCTTLLSEYA